MLSGSSVVGRELFYNQSSWDGGAAAITTNDDLAIASDKTAYISGSGSASSTAESEYSNGINGLMVDLLGGGTHTAITASDFIFKTGNNNAPSGWATAPAPIAITVRTGAGVSSSDRVEILWGTDAVKNAWLEVEVLSTSRTGLASNDVFYWGNLIGDSNLNFSVTGADSSNVLAHIGGDGSITGPLDHNRSKSVSGADASTALANVGSLARINLNVGAIAPLGGVGLNAPIGPQQGITAPAGAIVLSAASGTLANQTAVNNAAPGATIYFQAGTYADLSIQPKNNQTFIGQFGATLTSQTKVHAFYGNATGVTISNLVVDGYKTASQQFAIQGSDYWHVDHVEVRNSTAEGVIIGSHSSLTNSYVHDNGQMGIAAASANNHCVDVLIANCQISHNNPQNAFNVAWEAGGSKFWNVNGLTITHCEFNDNVGNGIWMDGDLDGGGNTNVLITNTWSHNNLGIGIFQEIGGSALITSNLVENNGSATFEGVGIELDDSESVTITNNVIRNNSNGILLESYKRSDTVHKVQNVVVTNNTIIDNQGMTGVLYFGTIQSFVTGVTFDYNQYTFTGSASLAWNGSRTYSWSQWQAVGNDGHSKFSAGP